MKSRTKIVIFGLLCLVAIALFKSFHLDQWISLELLKSHQENLQAFYKSDPWTLVTLYMGLYIAMAALSLPGAAVLTLAGGAVFGWLAGTVIVSCASTIGATCAFLVSRFLLRDSVQSKFQTQLRGINEGIKKDGAFYLFTLRLIPVFPFFLVNLLMGLTPLRTSIFFVVSQIGMLPGTAAFVNAGTELSLITSLDGVLSPRLLLSFALIGILPLISKSLLSYLKARRVFQAFLKPKAFDYNMVVIGGGSAGLISAYIGAAVRAKVALVEKHKMGGDCLYTGCIPSKALIRSAKIINTIHRFKEFGLSSASEQHDFAQIMERVQKVIQKIEPHDSVERYSQLGVECLTGSAKILSPWEVEVAGRTITTQNIVIATGARPFVPSIPGLEKIRFYTSDDIWTLRVMPRRLVILGGGPIGCELAQAFARIGSTVTLVEKSQRILSREDGEVSELIHNRFLGEGIQILTQAEATDIVVEGDRKFLVCRTSSGVLRLEFDQILLALGRTANVSGFGLEELGIEVSPKGTIVVDDFLRTKYPNIFACGDVAGPYQFTHTASHMAWYCAVNSLFGRFIKFKVDYRTIPWATFTDPEVSRVGLNELEAIERNIPYEVYRYDLSNLDRAIADEEGHGFVKVLLQPGTDKILGATIVGEHSSNIIIEYITAMKHGLGLGKILGTIHIYPTWGEANKAVAGVWKRQTQPMRALRWAAKFHAFMRK